MILIFAGAGASKAVNAEKYPTTVEFFENLPDEIRNDALFKQVAGYLSNIQEDNVFDIEQVLWSLHELKEFLLNFQNEKGIHGWFLNKDRLASLAQKGGYAANLLNSVPPVLLQIDSLVDKINCRVYHLYSHEPVKNELIDNWIPLFENISKIDSHVELITTNYDVVIENALSQLNFSGEIITGRNTYSVMNKLDMSCWTEQKMSLHQNKIRLTKLHGSVDWIRRLDNEIGVGNQRYTGSHDNHVIIYPGFKGVADKEPFSIFHKHFANQLGEAHAIIFIGFSFRDDYINDVLKEHASPNAKVIIIGPNATTLAPHFLPNKKEPISGNFDKNAVNECMKILSS